MKRIVLRKSLVSAQQKTRPATPRKSVKVELQTKKDKEREKEKEKDREREREARVQQDANNKEQQKKLMEKLLSNFRDSLKPDHPLALYNKATHYLVPGIP